MQTLVAMRYSQARRFGSGLEGALVPPGPEQGLLHQVLGVAVRADHPVAVHVQLPAGASTAWSKSMAGMGASIIGPGRCGVRCPWALVVSMVMPGTTTARPVRHRSSSIDVPATPVDRAPP